MLAGIFSSYKRSGLKSCIAFLAFCFESVLLLSVFTLSKVSLWHFHIGKNTTLVPNWNIHHSEILTEDELLTFPVAPVGRVLQWAVHRAARMCCREFCFTRGRFEGGFFLTSCIVFSCLQHFCFWLSSYALHLRSQNVCKFFSQLVCLSIFSHLFSCTCTHTMVH